MGFDVEEYSKKRKSQQKEETKKTGFDVEAYSKSRYAPKVGEEIATRVNSWLKNTESLVNGYNSRYAENSSDYRADTYDWLSNVTTQTGNLGKEAEGIKALLEQYSDFYDPEWVKSVSEALDQSLSVQNTILSNSSKEHEYWSQWEDEASYKRYAAGWLSDDAEISEDKIAQRQEIYQSNADRIAEIGAAIEGYEIPSAKVEGETFFEKMGRYLSGASSDTSLPTTQTAKGTGKTETQKLKAEKEDLEAENRRYEREQKELDNSFVPETEEFLQNAAYRDYSNPTASSIEEYWNGMDLAPAAPEDKLGFYKNGYLDALKKIESNQRVAASRGEEYRVTMPAEYVALYQEGYDGSWDQLTEREENTYYNLLKTEGQDAAYKFLDAMKPILNKRSTQAMVDKVSEAELGSLEQIFFNVASVPANILGGGLSFAEDAINTIQGKDINPYSYAHRMQNFAQAVRQDTASDINEWTGNAALPYLGTTWGDVYQALMSGADSLVGASMGGSAYGVLMGMGAASSTAKDMYEKGASMGQIAAGGVLAGAAEMVFEKVSIDNFIKIRDAKTMAGVALNMLKQGGIEASEEMLTEIANTITNAAVMGTQSDWQGYIDQYVSEGYSESQAVVKALFNDVAPNIMNAGIGGLISGGAMGGSSFANYANYQGKVSKHGQSIIKEGGVDTLKALALDMAGVKDSPKAREIGKLASKVDSKASANRVGRLSIAMEGSVGTQNVSDVQKALTEKGLSKSEAKRVAEYLTSGAELTSEQQAEIEGNEKVAEVVKELVNDPHSTLNQRKLNLMAARLGVDLKNKNVNATKVGDVSLKNDVDVSKKISEGGKTIKVSTGEEITINKNDAIAKTKVVGDDRVVYYNTDHGVVEATDVTYASEEDGLLFEGFSDMNPAFANAAIKNYDGSMPVQTYIDGMREGIVLYGMHNFQAVGKDISRNSDLAELSAADQAFALKLGRAYAKANVKKSDNALKTAIKNAAEKAEAEGKTSTTSGKGGGIRFENGVRAKTAAQKRAVNLAKHLAKAIGIDIVFYDAMTTTDKNGKGANGYFNPKDNSIHLDLQNALSDSKTIAFTLSHELVHFIKKWSPAKFNTFSKFLMEQYAAHGVSTSTLLANKMAALGETDANKAYEELIADACERMLLDSNAVVKLMELRKADLELFEKIKLHVLEILNNIRDAFKGVDPNTDEGVALQKMEDVLGKLHEMFEDAAVDAAETYQEAAKVNAAELVFGKSTVSEGVYDSSVKNQLKEATKVGNASIAYNEKHNKVNAAVLKVGVDTMIEMAETMMPYLEQEGILPPDIPGKTIFKNGSYGRTGENTTLCVRTLTYEDFKDRVSDELGRPLTVAESLLVSQKIYDIATDPQCIYCYVAADRKAYDEYLGEYHKAMDKYIKAMRNGGDASALYEEYLDGRKDTAAQQKRWAMWKSIANSGKAYISAKDLATRANRDKVIDGKGDFATQVKDAQRYAQSASWAKTVCDYRAYKGDILKLTQTLVDTLNSEYGLRMYSFSDYTPAFIVENMQMIIDASARGLKSLAYTKDTAYAKIFAPTGQAINVSCFAKYDPDTKSYVEDSRQGASWAETKALREKFRNVGAVMVCTNDAMVEWAMRQDWVDVVIPYHIVKTGTTIANEYAWRNYTAESSDRVGNKTANIYPTEHNNDFATYRNLIDERGITPRFDRFYQRTLNGEFTEEQYMKLVNEVRLPASELSAVVPMFDLGEAKKSFGVDGNGDVIEGGFVDKGGYMGGWYRAGVDVNQEVLAVKKDIEDGKSSLDVDYGMNQLLKEKQSDKYGIKKQAKSANGNVYDYSKSFAQQIDDYKNGLIPKYDTLLVSGTPETWKKVGFNALPVTINQTHVDYALNGTKDSDHHIGEALLKDLPNAIQNPVAIIQSQSPTSNNRAVVILKMVHNGKNVIGAVEVDGQGMTNSIRIDSNAMTSVFAKSNALTQLNNAIINTVSGKVELFYWNKKEATALLQSAGLQLSSSLPQDGFVHSIHENGSNVKTKIENVFETQQFKRWFGDWQNNPKKASKVVNADGTPMVVYHGSGVRGIDVFQTSNANGTGGLYLTTNRSVAESFAGKDGEVYETYVNLRKPFIVDANGAYYDSIPIPSEMVGSQYAFGSNTVDTNAIAAYARGAGYDGVIVKNVKEAAGFGDDIIAFESEQVKSATDNIGAFDGNNPNIRYQKKRSASYAPTFYSQMGKLIDDIKMDKVGSASIVNYLKGKGIKNDEIKWSGIEAFLEGKKSVTKAELQEFVAGSMLQVEEKLSGGGASITLERSSYGDDSWDVMRGGEVLDTYSWSEESGLYESDMTGGGFSTKDRVLEHFKEKYGSGDTRWGQYTLDGGSNYRELVFTMPKSSYSNQMMRMHWGQDAEGVLVHARIQDFVVNGKKMLFIEEIQSDYHNEGRQDGYADSESEAKIESLKAKADEAFIAVEDYSVAATGMAGEWEVIKKTPRGVKLLRDYREAKDAYDNAMNEFVKKIPDAPFRDTYHEYVLKRLLRMAAEEGYDSLGWTPAEIQDKRWDDNQYHEEGKGKSGNLIGYTIEYDQEVPKFLRKYGKRWGATVGNATLNGDTEIWSMDITDSMKESVLYEGQPMFQKKTVTNRTLLANALESAAQNDIERNKIAQYKEKISLIESEQAKLTEVREKANELRFTKGRTPDETKQMKSLDFEARQIENRINTYDRQLLNLESTAALKNVLQREKEMARKRAEQKGKEALQRAKEKRDETIRTLMQKNREARARGIESRSKTEIRNKIKDIVSDLNTLLLNPTKDKHVPIGLQKPVAAALDIINMDTVGAEQRLAEINKKLAKANDPAEIEHLLESYNRISLQGESLADKLTALKAAYAEIKNSEDQLIKNSHNEAIENLIENTIDLVGNTSLRDMSLKQLEAVYDMFKAIKATVRNANKLFKEGRQETVTENSEAVKTEVKAAGGHRERVLKATKWLKKAGWDMLKPLQAMRVIGSNTFAKLFENVRKGEDTWAVDVNEAKNFFIVKSQQYGYDSWDFKKQYTFNDSTGNSFSLSLEQIMSLYAYSKREQADLHLEKGGFIFDDAIEVTEKGKFGIPMKYEVNDANPYRLRKEDLGAIIGILETDLKDVKGFVDDMQAYLSDVMGAKGNEVSLAMYDIKLYNEKHYFPLKTARYFREFDPEKNGTPKVKNSGFSKKTVPKAGNPIVLSNFMDVWANHVNDMSMYHAFVLPLEDFMRVYNYSSTAGGYDSVQQYIKNAYGSQANQYIERLMEDLNGGARVDPSAGVINKGIALFKKSAVFASASVVIQQPSAIARATAYVDPKYFIDKPVATKHKETWAEVKKYAPVAVIKEMGYFDTNMGRSTVDWIIDKKTVMGKIDDIASKAPALADELAWCAIWKAVKREVADTTNLKVGSEEFLKRAGERFTEVVTNTQVYDSVLSRSGMMRSKDTGMKMATAFMAEPTTSLNMVVDAIIQGKRGNKKFAAKTIGAVAASVILNSILVSLVYAARDDDEDETYTEKYLASLTSELIDGFNPLTYIPFVKDVWSIAQGYDVERSDMSVVGNLWESIENLFSNNKSGFEKVEGVVGAIASIFGLPLKNLMRDARGMYNLTTTLLSGTPTTKAGVADAVGEAAKSTVPLWTRIEKWSGNADSKSDNLYDAIMSGDATHIGRLKSGYKDDKAVNTAIRTGLRENDSRIHEAAQARIDGNISEYARIVREIIAEGYFVQDIVVGAVNAEINAINSKADDQDETTNEEDETDKTTSIYRGSDINDAFESGDNTLAVKIIDDLIETKVANGMEEKNAKSSVRSSMTSYWKPLYKAAYKAGNTEEMRRIRLILKASGIYGSTSDILDTCKAWLKD